MLLGTINDSCEQYILALNYVLDLYFNNIYVNFNTFNYVYKRSPFLSDLYAYMQQIESGGFGTLQRKTF